MAAGQSPNSEIAEKPPSAGGEHTIEPGAHKQTVEQGAHEQMLLDSQKPVNGNGSKSAEVPSATTQSNTDNVKSIQVTPEGNTRFELKDKSVLISKDGVPLKTTTADGKTTEYEWKDGKLASIKEADGTSWRFEAGKWSHYANNGKPDGDSRASLNIFPFGTDRGVPTSGEISTDMLRNLRLSGARLEVAGDQAGADQTPTFRVTTTGASRETLVTAAETLRTKMSDKQLVEATILSFPRNERDALARTYQELTGKPLKDALKEAKLDSAGALLEGNENASERTWLKENLDQLKTLPQRSETREIVELSIRNQLRSLSEEQLKSLNDELLAKDGKSLKETITTSGLSQPTKDILYIYQKGSDKLTADDAKKIADIGLNTRGLSENARLLIFKEAFSGTNPANQQAREQFMRDGGENKIGSLFRDELNAKEALDVGRDGKVHIATLIDRQKSTWANNDAGIEGVVKNFMTQQDRDMFKKGMGLYDKGSPPENGTPDRQAYDYYKRIHESLENASHLGTSFRLISSDNRRKYVAEWEDIAANGEETLLGRVAKTKNEFFAGFETNKTVLEAIRNFTDKDFELMKDPSYRKRVFDLVGGSEPGNPRDSLFDRRVSINAQEDLTRIFVAPNADEARRIARPTLKQLAMGYSPSSSPSDADVMNTLGRSKPSEWTALGEDGRLGKMYQQMIENRVKNLPEGARESAQKMLDQLTRGEEPKPTLSDRVYEDMVRGSAPKEIVRNLLQAAKDSDEKIQGNPELEKALKGSLKGNNYEHFGKPLVEGRGLPIADLKELNWKFGFIDALAVSDGVPHTERPGHLEAESFYKDLRFASVEERTGLVDSYEKAGRGDETAKKYVEQALGDLTDSQRQLAINILKNPDQKMTLADRTRSAAIGDGNFDETLGEFEKLKPQEKIALMNEYQQKYGKFIIDDLMRKADDTQKKQIETMLPENLREAYRVQMGQAAEQSRGAYGSSVPIEVAMRQTQDMIKLGLQNLPEADRRRYEQEIRESLQKYTKALKDNDQAKDAYAKDLVDKITTVASIVAAPYAVANLTRLAVTGVAFAGFRTLVENQVKGGVSAGDVGLATMLGVADVLPGPGEFKALFAAAGKEALAATVTKLGTHTVGNLVSTQVKERLGAKLGTAMEDAYKSGKGVLTEADIAKLVGEEVRDPAKAAEISKALKGELDKAIKAREEEMARQLEKDLKGDGSPQRPRRDQPGNGSAGDTGAQRTPPSERVEPRRAEPHTTGGPLERAGAEEVTRVQPTAATRNIESMRGKYGPEADQTLNRIHQLGKRAADSGVPLESNAYLKSLENIGKNAGSPEKARLTLEVTERLLKSQLGDPIGDDKIGLLAQIVRHSVDNPRQSIPLERVLDPESKVESLKLYMRGLNETAQSATNRLPVTSTFGDRYEQGMGEAIGKALKDGNLSGGGNWVFVPGEKGSAADSLGIDGVLIDLKNNKVIPFDVASTQSKYEEKVAGAFRQNGTQRSPNPWVLPPADFERVVKPTAEGALPSSRLRRHLEDFVAGSVNGKPGGTKPPALDISEFNLSGARDPHLKLFPSLGKSDHSGADLTTILQEARTERGNIYGKIATTLGADVNTLSARLTSSANVEADLATMSRNLDPAKRAEVMELANKLRVWNFLEDQALHSRSVRDAENKLTVELTGKFRDAIDYQSHAGRLQHPAPFKLETPTDYATGNNLEPFLNLEVKSGVTFGTGAGQRTISEIHVYSGGAIKIVGKDARGVPGEPLSFGTIEDFVKHLEANKNGLDPATFQRVASELRGLNDLQLATRQRVGRTTEITPIAGQTAAQLASTHPGLTTLARVLNQAPEDLSRRATNVRGFSEGVLRSPLTSSLDNEQRRELVRFANVRGMTDKPVEDVMNLKRLVRAVETPGSAEKIEDLMTAIKFEKIIGENIDSPEKYKQFLSMAKAFERKNVAVNPDNAALAHLMNLEHFAGQATDRQLDMLVKSADISNKLSALEKDINRMTTKVPKEMSDRRDNYKKEYEKLMKLLGIKP